MIEENDVVKMLREELDKAHQVIREALNLTDEDPRRFDFYSLEIEIKLDQLKEANRHLQEAWKLLADQQIVIDRYKNFPKED